MLTVELLQLLLIGGVAYALGWDPQGSVLSVLALVVVGTAAFSGLGLLLGGTLRGLTCLAVANLAWLVLLVLGGIVFDLDAFGPAEPRAAAAAERGAVGRAARDAGGRRPGG